MQSLASLSYIPKYSSLEFVFCIRCQTRILGVSDPYRLIQPWNMELVGEDRCFCEGIGLRGQAWCRNRGRCNPHEEEEAEEDGADTVAGTLKLSHVIILSFGSCVVASLLFSYKVFLGFLFFLPSLLSSLLLMSSSLTRSTVHGAIDEIKKVWTTAHTAEWISTSTHTTLVDSESVTSSKWESLGTSSMSLISKHTSSLTEEHIEELVGVDVSTLEIHPFGTIFLWTSHIISFPLLLIWETRKGGRNLLESIGGWWSLTLVRMELESELRGLIQKVPFCKISSAHSVEHPWRLQEYHSSLSCQGFSCSLPPALSFKPFKYVWRKKENWDPQNQNGQTLTQQSLELGQRSGELNWWSGQTVG